MLGFERRAARITWTVALVAAALFTLWSIKHTLFILVLSIFFAYMVHPLVERVAKLAPKRLSHLWATAIVFAALVLAVAGVLAAVGPLIVEQASALANEIPNLANGAKLIDRLPLPDFLAGYRPKITAFVTENLQSGTAYAVPIARTIGSGALVFASNLIYVVLVPIFAFLLIKDGGTMRDGFLHRTDEGAHPRMWRHIVADLDTLLGGYMRALLILSLATLVIYSAVFSFAGVPYGLLLAVIAGALEFIPVLGPLAAAVICGVVAGVSGYDHVLAILVFIGLYRVFQDYVLNPYLMSEGATVPPLLVLLGLLAGDEVAGVVGIFLSVPVIAAAIIFVRRIGQEVRRDADPTLPV